MLPTQRYFPLVLLLQPLIACQPQTSDDSGEVSDTASFSDSGHSADAEALLGPPPPSDGCTVDLVFSAIRVSEDQGWTEGYLELHTTIEADDGSDVDTLEHPGSSSSSYLGLPESTSYTSIGTEITSYTLSSTEKKSVDLTFDVQDLDWSSAPDSGSTSGSISFSCSSLPTNTYTVNLTSPKGKDRGQVKVKVAASK